MIKEISQFFKLKFVFRLLLLILFPLICLAQENKVEALLSQADVFYIQGNYVAARHLYLEVSGLTDRKIYLSRAFFGAALCSFNLGDKGMTKNYLQKLFSIDPQKEISALFYPQSFLEIFQKVKREAMGNEKKDYPLKSAESEKAEQAIKSAQDKEKRVESLGAKEPAERIEDKNQEPRLSMKNSFFGGYWEIEIHYGRWGLQPALALFEKNLKKRIGSEVRQELTRFLSSRYGVLEPSAYEQKLSLEAEGWNEGLGVRYFSLGAEGSFSLGFSLERTHLRLKSFGTIHQTYGNGSKAEVEAEAFIQADSFCGHVSFRWDFNPRWQLSPYFIFGLGFGPLNGKMGYSYTGIYSYLGFQDYIHDSKDKTFKEWQEEEESHISLQKMILLQACLGLRIRAFRGLNFLLEAGIWDGFLGRGSLAFRF